VGRVDFSEPWRGFSRVVCGAPEGPPLSKLQKLAVALRHHLAHLEAEQVRRLVPALPLALEQAGAAA
jgi:hypothetical protein